MPTTWPKFNLDVRYLLGGLALASFLSFAFGRYSGSQGGSTESVKVSQTASVNANADSAAKETIIDHTVTTTTKPDHTVIVEKKDTTTDAQVAIKTVIVTRDVIKEVEKKTTKTNPPQWRVGLDAGLTSSPNRLIIPNPSPVFAVVPYDFGAHVERRILGPVWLGGRVTSDKSVGLTLSVEF